MAKPTTRVLAVLDLLQSHGRMSGPELARRVGVDVRTLRRYIVMLEDLGIPLTTERGRHGAYMLVAGFRLPPMMFTNDEAVALSVGMVAARGLGPGRGGAGGGKRAGETGPGDAGWPEAPCARDRRHSQGRPAAGLEYARQQCRADRVDRRGAGAAARAMGYDSGRASHTEREFDPYGLAWRAGAWYAVGMCHLRHGLRSFRLDRVWRGAPA